MGSTAVVVAATVGCVTGSITTVFTVKGVQAIVGGVTPLLAVVSVAISGGVATTSVVSTTVVLSTFVSTWTLTIRARATHITTILTVVIIRATGRSASVAIHVTVATLGSIARCRSRVSIVIGIPVHIASAG